MLSVNLRHLEARAIRLKGELPVEEMDLNTRDPMMRVTQPVRYDLEVQKLDDGLLVQGRLQVLLECECVRCLKPFERVLELNPWTLHLPLEGPDKVSVRNDCADLTPFAREDIILEFPQHPLCRPDCGGLKKTNTGRAGKAGGTGEPKPSAWARLDKLKL